MTDNSNATIASPASGASENQRKLIFQNTIKFGIPILLVMLIFVAYSLALASPALLDEQFLIQWLKDMHHLHASSGFSGFMAWPGFDSADGWGFTTKLFLLTVATLLGKNLLLLKCVSLLLHAACTTLTYLCSRRLFSSRIPAVFAAIFFAVYPLHFEAAAWLGGIGAELGTFFFLSATLAFISGLPGKLDWRRAALVGVFTFLALTSATFLWSSALAFALLGLVFLILPSSD